MIHVGLYGAGKHGRRYLDPMNIPWGVSTEVIPRGTSPRGFDAVIVATPPGSHAELACEAMRLGIPILCEKPMALTLEDAELMAGESRKWAVPLLIAHTHLWAPEFLDLKPSPEASVIWGGPEREDGSCPAQLDWGPHAWSMALTLGTEHVSTGKMERITLVSTPDGRMYDGYPKSFPMWHMMRTFTDLISGMSDPRADLEFALKVQRKCLGQ